MRGARLTRSPRGKASAERLALEPYWGKPTVRNLRGGGGNVGIIRSPVRATALPDHRKGTTVANPRSPVDERSVIFGKPENRPYGARLQFQVLHAGVLGNMENASILLDSGAVASLGPARQPSWEGGRRFEFSLEGFATAATAEAQGRQLSQAVLWMAVSLNYGLRLSYRTQEPASVFERLRSSGTSLWAEGQSSWNPQIVLEQLIAGFAAPSLDLKTLLSMEIYTSSALEASDRAAFLTAVSALEPLAEQEPLGESVDAFVGGCLEALRAAPAIDGHHRRSLEGRVAQLRRESVRQALRRFMMTRLADRPAAADVADHAYGLRSDLIHNGRLSDYDVDLAAETRKIGNLLRLIYSRGLGLALHAPTAA
jgi:hypothetical protein